MQAQHKAYTLNFPFDPKLRTTHTNQRRLAYIFSKSRTRAELGKFIWVGDFSFCVRGRLILSKKAVLISKLDNFGLSNYMLFSKIPKFTLGCSPPQLTLPPPLIVIDSSVCTRLRAIVFYWSHHECSYISFPNERSFNLMVL